ncbi:uncharacterized protein MKZ38_001872 [Zalerion maritima]|uniref:Calpain catalytic domain-containing protein n=1 Tax=Zalerion maritima TaxID=339359 RepID=A0AAD5RPU4_9PEZI|nr:uncharacterized protein MKZ38_001872 [Zalerion maritima]
MFSAYGYLSSSESEGPAPSSSKTEKKKGRKKKSPPQQAVNKTWREFVAKKPTTALSVLPFAAVPKPTGLERDNELLSAGFQRAAAECRSKVQKIIRECKRVNMRYRDPGFDLDWDLRKGTGNCLNSLGSTKFDVRSYRWWNIGMSVPKAVKRVHEVYGKPTFMSNISSSDIKQGALGDCWLISGLSGLANAPELLKRLCVAYDTNIGIYGFVFYRDGEWVYSIIDDKLYLLSADWDHPSLQRHLLQKIDREDNEHVYRKTYQNGSKALFFAKCKDENETWVPLMEKAYAKCHGDYASLEGGFSGEGLEDLTGGVTIEVLTSDILDLDDFWKNQLLKVNDEFLFSCTTGLLEPGYGQREGIEEAHAYMLLAARTLTKGDKAGTRLVLLRNPWGATRKGVWEGAFSDGSKEWTPEIQEELGHHFGQDSVFWITYEDLIRKFTQFDRTRLFRDSEWRCCQRFAGCEVPWKPQFEEKFTFKVAKETPLVLVLSQLDDRYFKGLQGQYKFKVHFRLHEKDKPDSEDYIVRSHGNYLMSRSVAVELTDIEPGEYSVFVSVTATRSIKNLTVEEVIKRETQSRSQNDKLAQIGLAYDLAHAKGAKHIEAMAKKRQQMAWKKASEKRKTYRRHDWEVKRKTAKLDKKEAKLQKERQKKREEERKTRREKREAEAKAKWEAEEAERRKKEEEEAAEQKKKKEEEAAKPKDKGIQTEVPESKTEDKSMQTDVKVIFGEDSDGETPQPTPQGSPSNERSNPCSAEGSVMDDEDTKNTNEESQKTRDQSTQTEDVSKKSEGDKPQQEEPKDEYPDEKKSKDTKAEGKDTKKDEEGQTPVKDSEEKSVKKAGEAKEEGSRKTSEPQVAKKEERKPPKVEHSDTESDSSAPPLSDWEELYSSDDMSRKPRREDTRFPNIRATATTTCDKKHVGEDEEDKLPDPWNAICVIGFKVYSQDEDLTLRVIDIEEEQVETNCEIGGAGKLGEKVTNDLDNAVLNAAGGLSKSGEKPEDRKDGKEAEPKSEEKEGVKNVEKVGEETAADEVEKKKNEEGGKEEEMGDGNEKKDTTQVKDDTETKDEQKNGADTRDGDGEGSKDGKGDKEESKDGVSGEGGEAANDLETTARSAAKTDFVLVDYDDETGDENYFTSDEKYFTSEELPADN